MSIETMLADLTAAIQKNTDTSLALIAALGTTAANQERLIAGQTLAIEKVEGGKAPTTTRTRARSSKADDADTGSKGAAAAPVSEPEPVGPNVRVVSEDDLRTLAAGWMKEQTTDTDRTTVGEFLKSVAENFGKKKLVGPVVEGKEHLGAGITDPDHIKEAWFFISRKKAGLTVDFSADYDWDADPTQGGAPAGTPADDEFDIG